MAEVHDLGGDGHRPDEPVLVVTRRTLRRVALGAAALVVLAGVGLGGFFLGRSSAPGPSPSRRAATSRDSQPPRLKTFYVPSTGMYPTIKGGDSIEVNLSAYETATPEHGDIIVFKRPPAEDCGGPPVSDLVRRVIGLPGETVSAHGGKVYITGKLLKESWLPKGPTGKPLASTYTTMTGSYKVPAGGYYVMGDNRVDSCDSRMWGPVSRSLIIGKVVKVLAARTTAASVVPAVR